MSWLDEMGDERTNTDESGDSFSQLLQPIPGELRDDPPTDPDAWAKRFGYKILKQTGAPTPLGEPHKKRQKPFYKRKFFGRFLSPGEALGSGSYGVVYALEKMNPTEQATVVKVIDLSPWKPDYGPKEIYVADFAKEIQNEINLMILLTKNNAPNVLHLLDEEKITDNRYVLLLPRYNMDLVTCMNRRKFKHPQPEGSCALEKSLILNLMDQIFTGLQAMHEASIVHTDLKPANILVRIDGPDSIHLAIADFGMSRFIPQVGKGPMLVDHEICTICYRAPELTIEEIEYSDGKIFTKMVDIWSAGCIMAEMILGQVLYNEFHFPEYSAALKFMQENPAPTTKLEEEMASEVPRTTIYKKHLDVLHRLQKDHVVGLASLLFRGILNPDMEKRPSAARARRELVNAVATKTE
jgi:serine/threonine protein kinase